MTRSILTRARHARPRNLRGRHNRALPDLRGATTPGRLLKHFEFAQPQAPTMTG